MRSLWRRWFGRPAPRAAATRARARTPRPDPAAPGGPVPVLEVPLDILRDRFHRFVLGLPMEQSPDRPGSVELATLRRLEALGERFDVGALPRLPSVLPQLLRLLKSDTSCSSQVARLIRRDPVLVGEVMRVTRSAYYRTARPVQSLQHAVVLLGHDVLRRVATQHMMKPILQASAGMRGHMAGPYLWEHAERCAHACAFLGRQAGCDAFEAYLAGMGCHAAVGAIVRLLDQEAPPSLEVFSGPFLTQSMRVGVRLSLRAARHWDLPDSVLAALEEYSQPGEVGATPLGRALQCASVLAMAQMLAEHAKVPVDLDYSHAWPAWFAPPLVQRCQRDLRSAFAGATEADAPSCTA